MIKKFILGVAFIAIGCIALYAKLVELQQKPKASMLIIGHRGACGYEPENTLVSFQRALDMGVDMIELDVYVCATGQLVVHHDDTVDRTTNGHGNVVDMSFEELRCLLIAGKEHIPTLEEVVELIDRKIPINIELKGPGTAKPVANLIEKYVVQGWSYENFVVSSFDRAQLYEFKNLCTNVKTGILFPSWNMPVNIVNEAQKYRAYFIGLGLEAVTNDLVRNAHKAGFPVFVWTVNDKHSADELRSFDVDGIFTDYPDRV